MSESVYKGLFGVDEKDLVKFARSEGDYYVCTTYDVVSEQHSQPWLAENIYAAKRQYGTLLSRTDFDSEDYVLVIHGCINLRQHATDIDKSCISVAKTVYKFSKPLD